MREVKSFALPLIIIALGLILFVSSLSIIQMKSMTYNVGSAFVPKILSIVLLILGVIILFQEIRKDLISTKKEKTINSKKNIKIILTFLALLAYILSIDKLGFSISSFVYLICQMLIMAEEINVKSILKTGVISIISVILIYFIFVYGFQLRLPMGLLS